MTNKKENKPLINLTLIIISTVAVIIATLIILYSNGVFLNNAEKLIGNFSRQRQGEYSGTVYTENYTFNKDGTGVKEYILPSGKTTQNNFTWNITEKNILVIDSHSKYYWNSKTDEYLNEQTKTIKKYWYVTNEKLVLGQNNSSITEQYKKIK